MGKQAKIMTVICLLAFCSTGLADELLVPAEYLTIQAAIYAAVDGDVVIVADGTYTGPGNRDIDFHGKAITVKSESGPENCIIDCNGTETDPHRGFYFQSGEDSNSILDGFTITGGYISQGGGISCEGSDPVIRNCIISNNVADMNGEGGYGGGIHCHSSNPIITNCIISDNRVVPSYHHYGINGGGVYCLRSRPIVSNCLIINNSAENGGGIYSQSSAPDIINCTFGGNSAEKGGAVYCTNWGGARITNSILWTDTAQWGNEIYLSNWFGSWPSTVIASYSDIPDGFGNIYLEWDCIMEWGQGNIHTDPCFVFTDDFRLMPGSPCIDAGDPCYIPEPDETDLDGNPRVIGDYVDMGAYEFLPPIEAEMKFTPQMLNCNSKGKYLKAHLTLPEGFLPEDVDVNESAIAEPIGAYSEYIKVLGSDKSLVKLEICFDRESFCAQITETGEVEITVIGSLVTGRYFYATDTIKIKSRH